MWQYALLAGVSNSDSCFQAAWWLERIVLPAVFLILGAGLGRVKDWLDERKARKAFLAAIRVELSEVLEHLKGTLKDAENSKVSLKSNVPEALHMLAVFQTGTYSSQVGKAKDLRDIRITEIIRFYDRLLNLERIKSRVTTLSFDLPMLTSVEMEKRDLLGTVYSSTLDEVIRRINLLIPEAESLIKKLN